MKGIDTNKFRQLDEAKLRVEIDKVHRELAKMRVEMKSTKIKNTNMIPMKKKELAVLLTILREKRS
ncbi:50S ribosomal protein L29 [Candidatus Woesebacteria bacterium]|jgi:ribosomal protein L29|nr:50S ribosomal protein L29 [Candidatus Woesebacteria bacterium]